MAQHERDTDRDDTSKDDDARPGLAYDPAVLAAKLAAAREQRRRVLAARAAAEGEPTPEERRAKLPPFARRPGGNLPPSPTGDAGASAGPPAEAEATPDERGEASVDARLPAARHEPGARVPETRASAPKAAPAVPEPRDDAAASGDGEPDTRNGAVPTAGADPAAARAATAEIAAAPGGRKPRRRPPPTMAEPPSHAPDRSAASSRSSTLLARLVPLGVLAVGWVLASLIFFAPATVRQRIADAIAPEPAPSVATLPPVSQSPPPPVAGDADVDPRPAIGVELATPEVERPAPPVEPPASGAERGAADAVETAAAPPPGVGDRDQPTRPRPEEVLVEPAQVATGPAPSPPPAVVAEDEGAPPARNATTEVTPATTPAITSRAPSGSEPATGLGPAAATSRVVLHVPASAAPEARRIEATLRRAGVADITLVPAAFPISRANLRYYRPEYRALGRSVADIAGRDLDGAPVEVRDFTAFRPQPSPGTLELWLAGTNEAAAGDVPATAPAAAAATPPVSATASPQPGPRAGQARVAERERLEDEVTRLLRVRLQDLQPE